MEKEVHCDCTTGCRNRRCTCLKNDEPCDENCTCADCQNPLNDVDVDGLSICAIRNIEEYKALSEEELAAEYELPCGCETISLRQLLKGYTCRECGEVYWFSFCWYATNAAIGGNGTARAATSVHTVSRCLVSIAGPRGPMQGCFDSGSGYGLQESLYDGTD